VTVCCDLARIKRAVHPLTTSPAADVLSPPSILANEPSGAALVTGILQELNVFGTAPAGGGVGAHAGNRLRRVPIMSRGALWDAVRLDLDSERLIRSPNKWQALIGLGTRCQLQSL
jgi:hypothetical protein